MGRLFYLTQGVDGKAQLTFFWHTLKKAYQNRAED